MDHRLTHDVRAGLRAHRQPSEPRRTGLPLPTGALPLVVDVVPENRSPPRMRYFEVTADDEQLLARYLAHAAAVDGYAATTIVQRRTALRSFLTSASSRLDGRSYASFCRNAIALANSPVARGMPSTAQWFVRRLLTTTRR